MARLRRTAAARATSVPAAAVRRRASPRRDGRDAADAGSISRRRCARCSRAMSAATCRWRPSSMSAAAWSAATGIDRSTVGAGRGARCVTSQAAEKIYRSLGADCRVRPGWRWRQGGWLGMVPAGDHPVRPRPPAAHAASSTSPRGARAMLGEILVFGRHASGERTERGLLHDRIEIRRDGSAALARRLRLDGDYRRACSAPRAGLRRRARAGDLRLCGARRAEAGSTGPRVAAGAGVRAGASAWSTACWSRAFWPTRRLRCGALSRCSGPGFRAAAAGLPPRLPRLWHV